MTIELDDSFDAGQRELCPDGSCTGVLDDDGVCKVCGARGTPPLRMATEASDGAGDLAFPLGDDSAGDEPRDAEAAADFKASGDEPFDADRKLCPDGNCIGVLDGDGRCKACGRQVS